MARPSDHSLQKPSTEARLAQELAPILSRMLQTAIQWTDISIYPARGYWRQTKADVMAWTGSVEGVGSLGCWESMTDCLRFGFDVEDSRNNPRAYATFEVAAKGRRGDAQPKDQTNG